MTIVELIVLLIIAAIAGAVGQALVGYPRGGFLFAIVMGFIGALVGTWLARLLGLPPLLEVSVGGVEFPIIWAILGAALLVALVGPIGRGGAYWGITPPTRIVLTISIVLAVLALLVSSGTITFTISAFVLLTAAYILLLLGNLVRGL